MSSKDDILFLAFQQLNWTWKRNVLDNPAITKNPDPLEQLKAFIELTFRNFVEQARLIQFVFTEAKHLNKEHLRAVQEIESTWLIGYWRELLNKVSTMVEENPEIKEMDISPLIAYQKGAIAVDGRIILEDHAVGLSGSGMFCNTLQALHEYSCRI